MLKTYENKLLIDNNGKLLKPFELPNIELELRYNKFPTYLGNTSANGNLSITTSVINTIYIDWGDGSEIYEREFSGTLSTNATNTMHTYTDGITTHIIKIWFKLPSKITAISWSYIDVFGRFPEGLMIYNLNSCSFNGVRFVDFSSINSPISITRFEMMTSGVSLTTLPDWLLRSRIERLIIGNTFNLSNIDNSRISEIGNIKSLKYLTFQSNGVLNIPNTFKDINTLTHLCFGGTSPIISITQEINNCKQISHLAFGYINGFTGWGSSAVGALINSWGAGIGYMNLTNLYVGGCPSIPSSLPTGIELCPSLKSLYTVGSYGNSTRIDAFFTNVYNTVINNASMTSGNTLLRQVTCNSGYVASTVRNARPTGTYQAPSGYIQGSDNGTPTTPMEMIWVLVKQYRWTIQITNATNNGTQTLTP